MNRLDAMSILVAVVDAGSLSGAARLLDMPLTTLGEERHFNTFFRLGNAEIIAGLREQFPELPEDPAPREVFIRLRQLRNKW